MTELQRLADLANHLHQEEPNPIVLPITQTGQQFDRPWHARNTLHFHERAYYLCSPGCGKPFTDIASKKAHGTGSVCCRSIRDLHLSSFWDQEYLLEGEALLQHS
jgi:hypothetical protein